jgi:hypothetical protein
MYLGQCGRSLLPKPAYQSPPITLGKVAEGSYRNSRSADCRYERK